MRNPSGDNAGLIEALHRFWEENPANQNQDKEILIAVRDDSPRFLYMYGWMSGLEGYRRSVGFKHAIRESGVYDYWQARGHREMCRPLDNDDFECD